MGRFYSNKSTEDGFGRGIEYFNRAIAIDPNYAPAWPAWPTDTGETVTSTWRRTTSFSRQASALQAIAIDDTLAEGHAALAIALTAYDWDWPQAESRFKQAIQLDPEYATAHSHYGRYLSPISSVSSR